MFKRWNLSLQFWIQVIQMSKSLDKQALFTKSSKWLIFEAVKNLRKESKKADIFQNTF